MQITKPRPLGLSTRPVEYRKRFGLCVTAYLHVPFAQGEAGRLWGEQSMWDFLAKEMAMPVIDEGFAKLTPEFLVHGTAFAPPGQPHGCAVRARLGEREKTLLVFGDRHWQGNDASAPAPFSEMPIRWERAYGGADFPANPLGRGREAADGIVWLPNIEHPGARILTRAQAVQPAGFGALDSTSPQRVRYRGTYDADYLKAHSPGFPPDLDWRHFNLASEDQWFDRPLRGDEPFAFDHLHPAQARQEGRLPGLRARVFASYRMPGASPRLKEVPMRLTTAWFFPHAERSILLFHGLAEVATDDGSDIEGLMGAVERLGEVKADAHYVESLAGRADPRLGAVRSLRDADLLPPGLDTIDPAFEEAQRVFASDGLQADAQYRRARIDVELARDEARRAGHDPDALGIRLAPREAPPKPDELAEYLEKKMVEADRQQWLALDDAVAHIEKAMDFAAAHKVDLAALQHRGPPLYSADAHMAQLKAAGVAGASAGEREQLHVRLVLKEAAERSGYLQSAHAQLPAAPMAETQAAQLHGEMKKAIALGLREFPGLDFTGADFSGLDLRQCNFAGAFLESANFSKANLSGANLARAVLAHADLRGVVAVSASFQSANLGRAQLAGAVLDEADVRGAQLAHCALAGTQLRKAKISGATLLDTTWGVADWTGVDAASQVFYKLDMRGLSLQEANLSQCVFVECDLSGCDLRGALLPGASFITCTMDGAKLAASQCDGAVFAKGCSLEKADLGDARLAGSNLGETSLKGARLVRATLDGANLADANLAGADLRLASAKGTLLRRASLHNANLAGINLMGAILQHADLRGTDMRRSNLFGADLSRVRMDGDVRLDNALLARARTWPRLTPQQQAQTP